MSHKVAYGLALVLLGWAPQDPERLPKPPQDPEKQRPLPPIEPPPFTAVERRDLLQEFGGPAPLAGVYRLASFRTGGGGLIPATGFLVVGRQYLSIQMLGLRVGNPALQSGFRKYRIQGDQLVMTTMIGFGNDGRGKMAVEQAGLVATRRFSLIGTRLTLYVEQGRTMTFDRIE